MINEFQGINRFLSNFYPSPGIIDDMGIRYSTVEHYYQAQKTLDKETRLEIATLEKPGDSKRYGNKIKLRDDWEDVKIEIMKEGLRQKFSIGHLRVKLKLTGNHKLIEGNYWHDNFWGICSCQKCKNIKGKNWLGILLMEIRDNG